MATGIELERVRRTSGGRVHLTPHVPDSGPVATLCGQTLAEATYEATSAESDCRNCLRRKDDAGRVSSAFFQSDVGAELLQRSLDQARNRRREAPASERSRPSAPAAAAPPGAEAAGVQARPASPPARASRPEPPAIRGLRSSPAQLRSTFENVYVSPQGVILRVADGAVVHVTFDGPADVRSRDGVVTVRVGDVVVEFAAR
jgi:hypothetical protein